MCVNEKAKRKRVVGLFSGMKSKTRRFNRVGKGRGFPNFGLRATEQIQRKLQKKHKNSQNQSLMTDEESKNKSMLIVGRLIDSGSKLLQTQCPISLSDHRRQPCRFCRLWVFSSHTYRVTREGEKKRRNSICCWNTHTYVSKYADRRGHLSQVNIQQLYSWIVNSISAHHESLQLSLALTHKHKYDTSWVLGGYFTNKAKKRDINQFQCFYLSPLLNRTDSVLWLRLVSQN